MPTYCCSSRRRWCCCPAVVKEMPYASPTARKAGYCANTYSDYTIRKTLGRMSYVIGLASLFVEAIPVLIIGWVQALGGVFLSMFRLLEPSAR